MSPFLTLRRLSLIALLAIGAGAGFAADAPADAKSAMNDRKRILSTSDLKKAMEEASKQRDQYIAEYEALAKQLKAATDAEKQQIREKMEAQKKQFEEVTSALHKTIRDEQRKLRGGTAAAKK